MRILFTGASSFTGYWFVKELVNKGHNVVAALRQKLENYTQMRRKRVDALLKICRLEFECEFGSTRFQQVIERESQWDVFCHHAAEVSEYKSPHFDFIAALGSNTKNLSVVLQSLQNRGCNKILLTGTIFEQDEGQGSHLGAVYPYALSKGLTYQVFRYWTEKLKMTLAKFVIPNPFGPYEEFRFTSYLVRSWLNREMPTVTTPDYIRDNIHVDLLAKAYCAFVESIEENSNLVFRPSGYVQSQKEFAIRFSKEMTERLSIPCPLNFLQQKDFSEPQIRINTDALKPEKYDWSEKKAWDHLASHYRSEVFFK